MSLHVCRVTNDVNTQNRSCPDTAKVTKNTTAEAKRVSPPAYLEGPRYSNPDTQVPQTQGSPVSVPPKFICQSPNHMGLYLQQGATKEVTVSEVIRVGPWPTRISALSGGPRSAGSLFPPHPLPRALTQDPVRTQQAAGHKSQERALTRHEISRKRELGLAASGTAVEAPRLWFGLWQPELTTLLPQAGISSLTLERLERPSFKQKSAFCSLCPKT